MSKQNIILNILCTVVLIAVWAGILFVSYFLFIFSPMFTLLGSGILVYISVIIYILAFVLPIVFRKRISKYLSLPLSFIVFTIISVVLVGSILAVAKGYISEFSQEKWGKYESLRTYMIDDLEEEYGIVGKTDKQVLELLGEPMYNYGFEPFARFEYYAGDGIDSYYYEIVFEKGIAKDTTVAQH
ncbi:MAG: hypothetical protein J6V58_00090 [Clostridia bacterium]|nr:hypothetical protein [Clostridia bacterium]